MSSIESENVVDSDEDAFRALAQSDTSDDDFEEADIEAALLRRQQRGRAGAKTPEEKKIFKAASHKKRIAAQRREHELLSTAGRAPRSLDVLQLTDFSGAGELAVGRIFKGRADAGLVLAEYCESRRVGAWFLATGAFAHPCSNVSASPCPLCSPQIFNSSGDSRSHRARPSRRSSACAARPHAASLSTSGACAGRAALGTSTILELDNNDDDDEDDEASVDEDEADDEEADDEEADDDEADDDEADDDEADEADDEEADGDADDADPDDGDAAEVRHPISPSSDPRGHSWDAPRPEPRRVGGAAPLPRHPGAPRHRHGRGLRAAPGPPCGLGPSASRRRHGRHARLQPRAAPRLHGTLGSAARLRGSSGSARPSPHPCRGRGALPGRRRRRALSASSSPLH
jgi:hypothetical protein